MHILALNAGSSTLKFRLVHLPDQPKDNEAETVLAEGKIEHVEGDTTAEAAAEAIHHCLPLRVDALGYRVVHGGSRFDRPVRLNREVVEAIRDLNPLAPLHNRIDVAVIETGMRLLPLVPGVAVFDTAFHRTLPEVAATYALPQKMSRELGLRRYGFHGISHRYVSSQLLACIGRNPLGTRLITCHLGNGSSVCAVRDGRSVDTSMGLTPLEGLVMGTRCGDLDPGVLLYLLNNGGLNGSELDDLLNHQSGLLGLSERSSDVRDLEQAAMDGNDSARLALAVFGYRVRKYLGAYGAALGGVEAIAFTGGIGEHSAYLRREICQGLEFFGISLDNELNRQATGDTPKRITSDQSLVAVWVIPTDEERQIVLETQALLQAHESASIL